MTPRQKTLERHALGLPNLRRESYRNRYAAPYCGGVYDEWARMVEAGLADASPHVFHGMRVFYLTDTGARAALEPDEVLSREDFPAAPRAQCDTAQLDGPLC